MNICVGDSQKRDLNKGDVLIDYRSANDSSVSHLENMVMKSHSALVKGLV